MMLLLKLLLNDLRELDGLKELFFFQPSVLSAKVLSSLSRMIKNADAPSRKASWRLAMILKLDDVWMRQGRKHLSFVDNVLGGVEKEIFVARLFYFYFVL